MAEHEVNLNSADVIKDEMHFGFTIHHNISRGTQVRVPWGPLNWFAFIGLVVFGLTMLTAFGSMVATILFDLR